MHKKNYRIVCRDWRNKCCGECDFFIDGDCRESPCQDVHDKDQGACSRFEPLEIK